LNASHLLNAPRKPHFYATAVQLIISITNHRQSGG